MLPRFGGPLRIGQVLHPNMGLSTLQMLSPSRLVWANANDFAHLSLYSLQMLGAF